MAEHLDDLLDEALKSLRQARKRSALLTGPLERWSIPRYLDAIGYAVRSLENLNEAVKRELGDNLPAYEALVQSKLFYHRMLGLGHITIGSVIKALDRHEVPEDVVRSACVYAYLHPKVREAIKDGYGLVPLIVPVPPKHSPEKPI